MTKSFEESLIYGFGGNWTILKTIEQFRYIQKLIETNAKICGWNTIKLKDGIYFPCLFKLVFDCDENGPSIGYEYVNHIDAEQLIEERKRQLEERKKQFDKNDPDKIMEW